MEASPTRPQSPRPWVVIAVFPGHRPKAIARTCYKTDADAYVRFLQRYMSQGSFYVVFDPPDQLPLISLDN
jgi:hypothetical protein